MGRTIVVVNDAAIASLFGEHSEIGRLTGALSTAARSLAVASAPKRTERLAGSVRSYANRHYTYGRRMAVYSDLHYARFVEQGTRTPITSNRPGGWMKVPARPGATRYIMRRSVSGQRANPFMAEALELACNMRGITVYLH